MAYCLATAQCFSVSSTSQTFCSNESAQISPCPGTAGGSNCGTTDWCGQDAQYTHNSRTLTCSNGVCGGTAATNEIVTDSLTKLVWQRTWVGERNWQQAIDYCAGLNSPTPYGGYNDWRLPNPFELASIWDLEHTNPSIDTTIFPGIPAINVFWSSSSYAPATTDAWLVGFDLGGVSYSGKNYNRSVRCVRGGPLSSSPAQADRFTVSGSGEQIVTDSVTGLVWQGSHVTGKTWKQALAYCEGLPYASQTDWRLPTGNELMSLVNYGRSIPASDFPSMPSDGFWSSTSFAGNVGGAWHVYFSSGGVYCCDYNKTLEFDVRCVRGGP